MFEPLDPDHDAMLEFTCPTMTKLWVVVIVSRTGDSRMHIGGSLVMLAYLDRKSAIIAASALNPACSRHGCKSDGSDRTCCHPSRYVHSHGLSRRKDRRIRESAENAWTNCSGRPRLGEVGQARPVLGEA